MDVAELQSEIEALAADPSAVRGKRGKVIERVIDALDCGTLRVAEPRDGSWVTHAWIKQAILLYFQRCDSEPVEAGSLRFFDKLPTKRNYEKLGARCVPPGVARYGSF